MVYHVMHMNTPVADVYTNEHNIFQRINRLVPDGPTQPFWEGPMSTQRFYEFMKGRCYEDGRGDLGRILAAAGMTENNPYEWCRRTHGVTWEDFFWIRYEGEDITWEDVRIR